MYIDDALIYTIVIAGAVIICAVVIYAMRSRGKGVENTQQKPESQQSLAGLPFRIIKSVTTNEAGQAKDELRILELEREILSDAIRRLYEAHAEGKITEEERERLAQTYKSRMMLIKDAITKDESIVALNELEAMQEDLVKLFSERFDDISGKIDELREKAEAKPIKEVEIPTEEAPKEETTEKAETEEKAKKKRRPPTAKPSPKTEAEKRIEEIRNEVEKVLDRLGQMEVES